AGRVDVAVVEYGDDPSAHEWIALRNLADADDVGGSARIEGAHAVGSARRAVEQDCVSARRDAQDVGATERGGELAETAARGGRDHGDGGGRRGADRDVVEGAVAGRPDHRQLAAGQSEECGTWYVALDRGRRALRIGTRAAARAVPGVVGDGEVRVAAHRGGDEAGAELFGSGVVALILHHRARATHALDLVRPRRFEIVPRVGSAQDLVEAAIEQAIARPVEHQIADRRRR